MSTITLTAQIEDGVLRLYPTSSFNNWFVQQNQEYERGFELFEYPEAGGDSQFVDRFYTAEQAVEAAQELT